MLNRLVFWLTLAVAVILLPRVYVTLDVARNILPIQDGELAVFDVNFGLWARAVFIAAHACVATGIVLIWRANATSKLKILTLILFTELVVIYATTWLFWRNGVFAPLY